MFREAGKRRALEKLSHPRIFRRIFLSLFKLKCRQKRPLVVLDAPLLFETKILEYFCYPILVVSCDDSAKQLRRLMERNGLSEEEAVRRVSSQMPIGVKLTKADVRVDNSGSLADLEKTVTGKIIPSIFQKLGYIDQ